MKIVTGRVPIATGRFEIIALALVLAASLFLPLAGCRQTGEPSETNRPASTERTASVSSSSQSATTRPASSAITAATTADGSVAIGSLTAKDMGRSVTVSGNIQAIQRPASGHATVTLADATGELPVYIRKETGIDLLNLTVGAAFAFHGRIQTYEGRIELAPAAAGDVRLTGGYGFEAVTVVSVVDGDTLHVRDRNGQTQTIRIIGIDTPEKALDGKPAEFYAAEATAFAERTLKGRTVYLERDNSETDKYDRLLRYVWLSQPAAITAESVARDCFSALVLQGGFGEFVDVGDDDKYAGLFAAWERQAQAARKGMWSRG